MQNDIKPSRPRRPDAGSFTPSPVPFSPTSIPQPTPTIEIVDKKPPKRNIKKVLLMVFAGISTTILGCVVAFSVWYNVQISPRGSSNNQLVVVTIESGTTPHQIAELLQNKQVIRNAAAFDIYTRLARKQDMLQAGTYRLNPAESTPDIVEHLVKGTVDNFSVTFLPGGTLQQHYKVLENAGYSTSEIDAAFKKTYVSPLFDTKPDSTDLEGYIYGETYQFNAGATVEQILERTFSEYLNAIQENKIVEGLKQQNLTLYQGITLASIIQREVNNADDQKQVAQVFYSRLATGMVLGSDVTYQYAADKLGVERDVNLDSPYNTRRYQGLPPGPISSPGLGALMAVANPAGGDYLYFLSGDDNVTYFARTYAEHEANIKNHCQQKCSIL